MFIDVDRIFLDASIHSPVSIRLELPLKDQTLCALISPVGLDCFRTSYVCRSWDLRQSQAISGNLRLPVVQVPEAVIAFSPA